MTVPIVGKHISHLEANGSHVFFNPVSGGYAVTDSRGAGALRLMQEVADEDAVIDRIAEDLSLDPVAAAARYVAFSEGLRRRGLLERLDAAAEPNRVPYFGFIEVTRKCPTLCKVCAIDTGRGSDDVLTLAELKGIIDQFKEIGTKYVALTGGDPLLRDDLVRILDYAKKQGLGVGFSSSLVTLKDSVARDLAAVGSQVQVSIDGSTSEINDYNRGPGTFEKALEGIELLRKHGVEFRIAFCIMKHNVADIPAMIRLAEGLGAKEVAFRKIKLLGRALERKEEVYPDRRDMATAYAMLYREAYGRKPEAMRINSKFTEVLFGGRGPYFDLLPCGAGRNIIHVTYRGDVVPCSLFTEDKFIQGNVRRDRIAAIWERSRLLRFFRDTRVDDIPKCRACTYKYLCGGGCRAEAYFLHGDLMADCCDCDDLLAFYGYIFGHVAKAEKPLSV